MVAHGWSPLKPVENSAPASFPNAMFKATPWHDDRDHPAREAVKSYILVLAVTAIRPDGLALFKQPTSFLVRNVGRARHTQQTSQL